MNQPDNLVSVIGHHRGRGWESVGAIQFDPLGRFLASLPGHGPGFLFRSTKFLSFRQKNELMAFRLT